MSGRVDRRSLKDQVRDVILQRILSGEFAPGERLKITPLAESLGVSQVPVREAIHALVASGYLALIPNVGASVKQFSLGERCYIYEVRQALEVMALERLRISCTELASQLEEPLKGMKYAAELGQIEPYTLQDIQFHRLIVEASCNPKMIEVWDSLMVPAHVLAAVIESHSLLEEFYSFHVAMAERIKQGALKEATKLLVEHYCLICGESSKGLSAQCHKKVTNKF